MNGDTPMAGGSPEERAQRIADAAAAAWHAAGGGSRIEIPLGVAAAVSLVAGSDPPRPSLPGWFLYRDQDSFVSLLRQVWARFYLRRPELCIRVGPLARWLDDGSSADELAAAVATTEALITSGISDWRDADRGADLLGCVYRTLTDPRAAQARGMVHTAADVAEQLPSLTLADARPGQVILDEEAGTGTLLRAAARVLARRQVDPRSMHWYATDIDRIAVAALAVNVDLWDLGPHVVIGTANILTEPDWHTRARAEQEQALRDHELRFSLARLLAAEHVITRDWPQQHDPGERM